MKVTCCGSGYVLQRCTGALKLVKHFTPLIFSSLSWLYLCSRFPAEAPAHAAAHITPIKCICRHLYKVGPQLPFSVDNLEYLPCNFPPQAQVQSVHSCYISLCLWKGNTSEENTSSTSDTTTGPSLLAVHTWRHVNDTTANSPSFSHDFIWDTSRNWRHRNRLLPSIWYVSALVLKSPRKAHFLEDMYNYTCFNARPPETSFFKCDLPSIY